MIRHTCAFLTLLLLLFFNVFGKEQKIEFGQGKVVLMGQSLILHVEVAKTELQRNTGLMFREKLNSNYGMIFVFEQQQIQRVWMKNTLIALDVIFISGENKIVSIIQGLQPCLYQICPIFSSSEKAKFMLEVKAGTVQKNVIKIGQQILLEL